MNIISWNCRGTGSKSFPGLVRDLKSKYNSQFVILLETHSSGTRNQAIIKKMGFDGQFVVDAEGQSGGIWCLWDKSTWSVKVEHSCRQFVHLIVSWQNQDPWALTAVYGSPHKALRHILWDELKSISSSVTGPWCAIGDFNALLDVKNKEGGRIPGSNSVCKEFQRCLLDCGLHDMGFKGNPFTWHRRGLRERLDRAVINATWRIRFEEASVYHLPNFKSDHVPLWLCFHQKSSQNKGSGPFDLLPLG